MYCSSLCKNIQKETWPEMILKALQFYNCVKLLDGNIISETEIYWVNKLDVETLYKAELILVDKSILLRYTPRSNFIGQITLQQFLLGFQ